MPYVGGRFDQKRQELEANLRGMEERYARYVRARQDHHPDALYLKQLIDDARRVLRGR